MKKAKRGRPKGTAGIQRQEILEASLEILDELGPQGLTMRGLAERLKVTPMALYHHVADRSALLREVSDLVYSEVFREYEGSSGSVRRRLEKLLVSYHKAVIRHPNLTLSIFADPNAFSREAQRITQQILELLGEANLSSTNRKLWLDILVDFTHGSSVAIAMQWSSSQTKKAFVAAQSKAYTSALRKLLDCIF